MKKKLLNYLPYFTGVALLLSTACNDLDLSPTDKFTEDNYWVSAEKANLVLNMAYNQMYGSSYYFSTEALSDNIYEGRGATNEKIISSGQADASNGRFEVEWKDCYAGIKTCHTFLENVDKVPSMDGDLKARMVAEARFIRAYLFFRLTTWYGDVPLFSHDLTLSESKSISRTPQQEVLTFVRAELEEVSKLLPSNKQYAQADKGRITSGAAIALLARTYLYSNDWANVVRYCEMLMTGDEYGKYELYPTYDGLFLSDNENNNEVILDIQYVPSLRTWGNFFDYAPLSVGARLNAFAPTQELVDSYVMANGKPIQDEASGYDENNPYKNRDPRLSHTVVYHQYNWKRADGSTQVIYIKPGTAPNETSAKDEYKGQGTNSTSTGYYLRKYYDAKSQANFESGLNLIMLRYADVLLMYAEAKTELGQMTEQVWNATVRALRARAGFTEATALNFNAGLGQSALRDIVRGERRSELAIEGLRIFDIRRWRIAEQVLNIYPHGARYGEPAIDNGYIRLDKRYFNPLRDYLWAVPQSQKDINAKLGQNTGY